MGIRDSIAKTVRGAAGSALRRVLAQVDPPPPLPSSAPASAGSQVRRYPYEAQTSRQIQHPGHGLEPATIVRIFAAADAGNPAHQCDLFDDIIQRDPHLRSQIEQRIGAVAGKEWSILAGGPRPIDHKAAELLQAALAKMNAINFHDMLVHQLRAAAYGYAATEIDWGLVDGVIAPVWFSNERSRRFRFGARDECRIITEQNRTDGEPLEPGRWIVSRAPGDFAALSGFMRSLVIYSYFKGLAVRDWMVLAERWGMPTAYGIYTPGTPDKEKDELLEMVQMIGKDGAGIFSTASKIEIMQAQGANSDAIQAYIVGAMDAQITKLITGALLLADGADGGSYAQSKVQQGVRFDITLADAVRLGNQIQQDIGASFVAFNGMAAAPPRLHVHVVRDYDPLTRMKVFEGAQKLGVPVSLEQVRQENQLKKPLGPEDELKAPAPAETTPPADDPAGE